MKLGTWHGKELKVMSDTTATFTINLTGKSDQDCTAVVKFSLNDREEGTSQYTVSGPFNDVFDHCVSFLSDNDIAAEKSFIAEIDEAKFNFNKTNNLHEKTSAQEVGYNLRKLLEEKNKTVTTFASETKKNSGNIYRELKGNRPISIDQAINYSKNLNCDPVKILFKDLRTKVWGLVDPCNSHEAYRTIAACEIVLQAKEDQKTVIVPRDIYQENIEAIKIISKASSFDNHFIFYYKSFSRNLNLFNKQVVIGYQVDEEYDESEIRYYYGILENHRGKLSLINPDPFKKAVAIIEGLDENKITFVSEVVAILNSKSLNRSKRESRTILSSEVLEKINTIQSKLNSNLNEAQLLVSKLQRVKSDKKLLAQAKIWRKQSLESVAKASGKSLLSGADEWKNLFKSLPTEAELDKTEQQIEEAINKIKKSA